MGGWEASKNSLSVLVQDQSSCVQTIGKTFKPKFLNFPDTATLQYCKDLLGLALGVATQIFKEYLIENGNGNKNGTGTKFNLFLFPSSVETLLGLKHAV